MMKTRLVALLCAALGLALPVHAADPTTALSVRAGKIVNDPSGKLPSALLSDALPRDYGVDLTGWINARLAGKTANAGSINLLSAGNFTSGTGFARNPNLWCAELDFSCFSPWNSAQQSYQGGTLITPRHVWLANHFSGPTATSIPPGSNPMTAGVTQIAFLGTDGVTYTRTIATFTQLGSGPDHDVLIGTLDSELPAAVRPARFLPTGLSVDLLPAGTPVIFCNKNKEARVAVTVGAFGNRTITTPLTGLYAAWTTDDGSHNPGIVGDSGSPVFLVLDGQLVAWFEFQQPDRGASPLDYPTELAAALGSYQLTRASLNPMGSAAKLDTGNYPGQVPKIGLGGKLDSSILPDNSGALSVGSGTAGAVSGTGLGGNPGAMWTPAFAARSGNGGASLAAGNGGAGGFCGGGFAAFSAVGGDGGANNANSFNGGDGGQAGRVELNGAYGGGSMGSNGGLGGAGGVVLASGGRGGTGTAINGGGKAGGNAGALFMNGGNAATVQGTNQPGANAGNINTSASHNNNGSVGLPGGSIDTSAGGGHVLTKAVNFSARTIYPVEGTTQAFNDSTTGTVGTLITGGGSFHVQGYFNGTEWLVGTGGTGGAASVVQSITATSGTVAITAGTNIVVLTAALTGSLTLTLPPASGYAAGRSLIITDPDANSSALYPVSIAPGGGDNLNGASTAAMILTGPGNSTVYSDGVSRWSSGQSYIGANANGLTIGYNGAPWLRFDQYGYAYCSQLTSIQLSGVYGLNSYNGSSINFYMDAANYGHGVRLKPSDAKIAVRNNDDTANGDFEAAKVKASTLNLTGLPTSSSGLSSGDVWNNAGVLQIVP